MAAAHLDAGAANARRQNPRTPLVLPTERHGENSGVLGDPAHPDQAKRERERESTKESYMCEV